MKGYKLLKDLPTFKAGEIFDISSSGNLVKRGQCISDCIVAYSAQTLEKFPNILKDWFEEIPEQPKTVWHLEEGDEYYSIASDGFITTEIYHLSTQSEDDMRRKIGNAFLTKKEAEKELTRRKAKVILERDTKGFKPNWKNKYQDKYEVLYDYEFYKLVVDDSVNMPSHPSLWFATEEDAKESIKNHEKEWKIYLGVEE